MALFKVLANRLWIAAEASVDEVVNRCMKKSPPQIPTKSRPQSMPPVPTNISAQSYKESVAESLLREDNAGGMRSVEKQYTAHENKLSKKI